MTKKHMKRYLMSLVIREMQIETMEYNEVSPHTGQHGHHQKILKIKQSTNNKCWRGCGEKETFLHCWWECKLIQLLWRTITWPAIPFLGKYLEKTIILKDTCTPVFIEELFRIARKWKQCKCPSTEKWIKKIWHIYIQWNGILLTNEEQNNAICSSMNGPRHCLTEWTKSEQKVTISLLPYPLI